MPEYDPIAETDTHARAIAAAMGLGGTALDRPAYDQRGGAGTFQTFSGGGGGGDLIDNAITARQNFEAERGQLINQIAGINPRSAYAHSIAARLHGIDQQEHALDWEAAHRMQAAREYNAQHDKELTHQRRADIDEHGAYLMSAIANLDNLFHQGQIDREEYNDGILQAMQRYPMGIENPAAAKHLDYTVQRADRMADFEERLNLRNNQRSTQKLEQDLLNKTGLSGEEFAAIPAESVRAGKFVNEAKEEVPLGHVGGTFTNQYEGAEKGPVIEIDTDEGPLHMSRAAYDKYRRVFGGGSAGARGSLPGGLQPTAPVSTIRVQNPNGQTGTIPASQLQEALKAGYKQVQ